MRLCEEGESRVLVRLANKLFREGRPFQFVPTHPDRQNDTGFVRRMRLADMDFDYRTYSIKVGLTPEGNTLCKARHEIHAVNWHVEWTPGGEVHCLGDYAAMVRDLTMIMLSDALHG